MHPKSIIKLIIHSIFWILYIVVLFVFDPLCIGDVNMKWYETSELKLLLLVFGIAYLNDQVLLPYLFKKKSYGAYAVSIFCLLFSITFFYCYFVLKCYDSMGICFSDDFWIISLPIVFLSFIWMVLEYYEKQNELDKAQKDNLELELKFLKAQINPHVLFNSLNTIYSKAVNENDEVAELILMLSENLKYVLYRSNKKLVDLEKDLRFIENYLKFQELRTQGVNNIIYKKDIDSYHHNIAPLILIDFIENAFKYSLYKENELSAIEIRIEVNNGQLKFCCKNEYADSLHQEKEEGNKIGIENLKHRLKLIYQDKYVLSINKSNGVFEVDLKIDLR